MKRSTFIYYALIGTALVAVPSLRCGNDNAEVLKKPQLLSRICDAGTLIQIGNSYRRQFPGSGREQLIHQILEDKNGAGISRKASRTSMASSLEEKVKEDFTSGRIVTINGWVLSETEARQCALLSIS